VPASTAAGVYVTLRCPEKSR